MIQHEGTKVKFRMDALRSFRYPMVRQVNEGTRVRLRKFNICMNSKSEVHQPGIVRVVLVRGNVNEEHTGVFPPAGRGRGTRGRGRVSRARRGAEARNRGH